MMPADTVDWDARRAVFKAALAAKGIERCVIVSGSFRAGTSLICSLLGSNGMAGIRLEKFSKYFSFRKAGLIEDFSAALNETLGSAQDGLFVTKMM